MDSEKCVPRLRFPEFADMWKHYKLGDLYTERNERGNDSLQILTVSIHSGVSDGELDEDNLGKTVRRSADKTTYKRVYPGDLVFNMMRAWQGAIGVVKSEGMISPAYISAIPNDSLYPLFMDYSLRRPAAIEQIDNLSYGVTDFRKRLYWNSFINVDCWLPSIAEQKKVWALFSHMDQFILNCQAKIDLVKQVKTCLLQKMFPCDGSAVPEVRFPGFTDDWEQRKVGDVASIVGGNAWKSSEYVANGEYLVITIANVSGDVFINDTIGNHLYCDNPNGYLLSEGDILVSLTGNVGRVSKMTKTLGLLNQRVGKVLPLEGAITPAFLFHVLRNPCFENAMIGAGQGAAQKNISNNDVLGYPISLPKQAVEQKKIGEFFDKLDTLITLHQRKLEQAKLLKAGLLQQMFV